MNPRIILAIFKKDIVDAIKNTYILFSLILPVGMSLLFGILLPGRGTDELLPVAAYGPGESPLIRRLQENSALDFQLMDSAADVTRKVEEEGVVGLVLPEDFDESMASGKTPGLTLYYNGTRTRGEYAVVQRILESTLRELAGQVLPATLAIVDVAADTASAATAFDYSRYMLILFLSMGLIMTGVFVVPTILVEEKEKHTLQAVLVSPASNADLVAGKALVGLVYALLTALVLLALNGGFSGNPAVTLLAVLLGSLFLVLCGLLLGALFSNSTQVNTWSSVVMLVFLIPTMFVMVPKPPEPIPTITSLIPTTQMAEALGLGLSGKATLANSGPDLAVLGVCAAAVFALDILILRRERK